MLVLSIVKATIARDLLRPAAVKPGYSRSMNSKQLHWLTEATSRIPALFQAIKEGQDEANTLLGERVINGQLVRLSMKAVVVDPGHNPLANHASTNFPAAKVDVPDMPLIKPRHRKRPNRW